MEEDSDVGLPGPWEEPMDFDFAESFADGGVDLDGRDCGVGEEASSSCNWAISDLVAATSAAAASAAARASCSSLVALATVSTAPLGALEGLIARLLLLCQLALGVGRVAQLGGVGVDDAR